MPPGLRRAGAVLLGIDLLLVAAYLVNAGLGRPSLILDVLVDLDAERTVAVWYTSAKLLLAGALFLRVGIQEEVSRVGSRSFLILVGIGLLALSLDETAGLHELVTVLLRPLEALPRFRGDHGMWIPFVLVGLAAFLVGTARSWRRLWTEARAGTALLGLGLVLGLAGAVGLEVVGYQLVRPRGYGALHVLQVAAEEGLELAGASLLLLGSVRVFGVRAETPVSA